MPDISWFTRLDDPRLREAVEELAAAVRMPGPGRVTVVWADRPLPRDDVRALLGSGGPVVLAGPTLDRADPDGGLAEAAGLVPGGVTPRHDIRVRAGRDAGALGHGLLDHVHGGSAHLGEHAHLDDRVLLVDKTTDDVEELLTATVGLAQHPVATWRPSTGVLAWTPGTTAAAVTSATARRLLLLALRRATGVAEPPPLRVGLLGYGAIGHEHSRAVRHVDGLELAAVCDVSPERLAAAQVAAPGCRAHTSPDALLADPDVDLVVVSTPPVTHAEWAGAVLAAGKHVVVEKPFAIRTAEADAVLEEARRRQLLALVYQNRRFDPDHLAVRRLVHEGRLGEVFHVEAFVGGYGHPCNLWHSDAEVSGGAVYDWGAHVLDQLLDLVPAPVEHVTAAEHKRRWFDVTNADHSRVTVRFEGGAEASFVYSELAAALKPRWYVLGTRGAVVGHWRHERVVGRTDIGTLSEDVLAPADSPPVLELHDADGSVTRLATPAGPPHAFHRDLADHVRLGLPLRVTGEQSRRVLAVMEAAAASAADGGRPVTPR